MQKVLAWSAGGLVAFAVFSDPVGSSNMVNEILCALEEAARAVQRFIQGVFEGQR